MTPQVKGGPLDGAEAFKISVSREDTRVETIPGHGEMVYNQASIGGTKELGFYLVFRGEPDEILDMLEVVHAAAKQMLPAGRYNDKRTQR